MKTIQQQECDDVFRATGRMIPIISRSDLERKMAQTWVDDKICDKGMCIGCAEEVGHALCAKCRPLLDRYHERDVESWVARHCPPLYRDLLRNRSSESVDWERVSQVENWQFEAGKGLYLVGDTGTGKTTAMIALGINLIRQQKRSLFVSSIDLARRLSKSAYEGEEDADLITAPVLMIDDFGKERLTDNVCSLLYEVIEKRLSHYRPIVLSTRLKGDDLVGRFSDKILITDINRRLVDGCEWVLFRKFP